MNTARIYKIMRSSWKKSLANNEELAAGVSLMKEIKGLFPDNEIYIVGGVPRDLYTGDEVEDVDLATNIPFEDLKLHFELRDISKNGSQPVHKLNYKGYSFDIAQFRKDSKTEGRHNNVSELTDSFEADSARRDISINSMGLNDKGEIIDYQGGLEDIHYGIIRTVGNPEERFREDATRILRVARFAAKTGFDICPKTKTSMILLGQTLLSRQYISEESISREFYKAGKSGPTLRAFLEILTEVGILQNILPEFFAMEGMLHNPVHHPEGGSTVIGHILECLSISPYFEPVVNLAVLFHDFGKAVTYKIEDGKHTYHGHEGEGVAIVDNILKRLKFADLSAEDKESILISVEKHMMVHKIQELSVKTLVKLVNEPSWKVLKKVAYCDEACRGWSREDAVDFLSRMMDAEEKVQALGDKETLRKAIAAVIDGHKLINMIPELGESKNRSIIGRVLKSLQEMVLEGMDSGKNYSDEELFDEAKNRYYLLG